MGDINRPILRAAVFVLMAWVVDCVFLRAQLGPRLANRDHRSERLPCALRQTDSTIAPPRNQRVSLTNVSWLLDTGKDDMKSTIATYFLVGKGLSKDDVGGARGIVFQEIGPGELVSKPEILFKKCWGGYRRTTRQQYW